MAWRRAKTITMSKTLQEIKDQYAKERGYEDWDSVLRRHEESLYMDEIATRYALACCKATQEKCAENATLLHHDGETQEDHSLRKFYAGADYVVVSKASVLNPSNIVLL
jgi:hypothetical protein